MGTYNRLTPNLMVDDVAESLAWYEDVLGAEELARMPPESDEPEWGQVEFGDVWLMFQARDSLEDEVPALAGAAIGGSLTMYVDTDDAREVHERAREAGATVVQALHETDYGRLEFAIEDPNGYVLAFGEQVE